MTSVKMFLKKFKGPIAVLVIFSSLSVLSFNCAPQSFKLQDATSLVLKDDAIVFEESFDTKPTLPEALLTSEQIFKSLLNLTNQNSPDDQQLREFNRRQGSFPISSEVSLVNSPMLMSLTSLAGTVCNSLVTTEMSKQMTDRKFFGPVTFTSPVANLAANDYSLIVDSFAKSLWGRAPSSEENQAFLIFRNEFIAEIPSAELADVKHTRNLMISTCTAVSSSFDVFTY